MAIFLGSGGRNNVRTFLGKNQSFDKLRTSPAAKNKKPTLHVVAR